MINYDATFRKGERHAFPKSSLFPYVDASLPYLVSTDKDFVASTDNAEDAVAFADRLASIEPKGNRIFVTFHGIVFYRTTGWGDASPATKREVMKPW